MTPEQHILARIALQSQIRKDLSHLDLDFPDSLVSEITTLCLRADGYETWLRVRSHIILHGIET